MKRIAWIFLAAFALLGCGQKKVADSPDQIAVSILPQEYFVNRIAGDKFKVNVMIPPGASPATYEPTPAQLTSLSGADLYLKIGFTGFELAWMEKIASVNKEMKIVDLSEGVSLITEMSTHDHGNGNDDHHGGIDPHIWLSPVNAKIISSNICKALSERFPEYSDEFNSNLDEFLLELDSLDSTIRSELSGLSSRTFFTYHPSLSYYARDYDLEQLSLELGGKTPSPTHMKYLVDTGKEKKIGLVFLQMQFDQKNAEVLAKEIDAEIVQINPLDPEWHQQMLFITEKLAENLK
jgi:zinc transport system substrate-binding protein